MSGIPGSAALAGYALLLSAPAPALLRRAAWVTRAPCLAVGLWLALSVSWLMSVILAGLKLAAPWLWLAQPGRLDQALPAAGAALAACITARAGYVLTREMITARQKRRRHGAALAVAGRALPGLDATVVDHQAPAVYCLPGPRRLPRIVVTSGALSALSAGQLAAVLAHERAHLRRQHHLPATVAASMSLAFPGVPLLRHARGEIEILTEMTADDDASRQHGAAATASALAALASAQTPEPALGAGGHTAVHRIQRLLEPAPPLRPPARLAGLTAAAGALALPAALACTTIAVLAAAATSLITG